MKNIELLSPAGSFESVKSAIKAGCDAVYIGGNKYSARAYAETAEYDNIYDSIRYAKEKGKNVYVTVNTILKNQELKDLFLYTDKLVDENIDAFIVQDMGVAKLLKERYKNMDLHASTQTTVCTIDGINLLEKFGFKRVVLARELSLDEIKYIRDNTDMELEVFVHGSMCYSYSGTCLMSSFIGGQSGNRGRCKGPCRHEYNGKYLLSMKDLCNIKYISALKDTGIDSIKIEGRMRKPLYVAGTTYMYRQYLDGKKYDVKDEEILREIYDKGGFTSYLDTKNDKIQIEDRKKRVPDKKIIDFVNEKFLR